ncbi:hypothetical protein POL68_08475 [Stigmatella sp. ncwal1]|uniref:PLAT domain-containing protein n=1 Tax=Stigmatella ashevillensis TaxID=2995309 RepID=A0ABT5D4K2_9BACT|nr:hypothetical protein [Stigmatella ashevillena]MDC0708501.1 hypothetical protein [Stigmatella ashevillena]
MNRKLLSAVLVSTSILFSAGCGDDEAEGESIDVEGCEHLQEGPSAPITAAATATGAPAVSNDHKRYDISLVDVTGGKGGSVTFAASEAGDYLFFVSEDVPLAIRTINGVAVEPEEVAKSSSECSEIKGRYTVELSVGTHVLTFGPTSKTSISLVAEHGEHDHVH